jgi:autocrine motility factor receptor
MPFFEAAVVAHAAASGAAAVHLLKSAHEPTLAAAVARLLSPPTPNASGLLLLGNVGVSCVLLLALALKAAFLGSLSAAEAQNASERAISWVLFKVVTLAALEAEPDAAELLAWGAWFTLIGVIRVFVGLAKDRFERLSAAPSTTATQHARTVALLGVLLGADAACMRTAARVFAGAGGVTLWLLLHDTLTTLLQALLHTVRYASHLYEVYEMYEGDAHSSGERRREWLFVLDFMAEACIDLASLCHAAALYWMHGLSLQLVDAIILLHMRALAMGLTQRVARFIGFLAVSRDLNHTYGDVPADELAARQDDCAVCRERLDKAKRLPCGHLFHAACLQVRGGVSWHACVCAPFCVSLCVRAPLTTSGERRDVSQRWLEVKTECPTCRAKLHAA